LADDSGLVICGRVGKHTDRYIEEIIVTMQGRTSCQDLHTDDWCGYEQVIPVELEHTIGKDGRQRLERTNGILRQQNGRWHRKQNKFAKSGQTTKMRMYLAINYFNWIWKNSRSKDTAAQRAGLGSRAWLWDDFATYRTLR
jgi:insertion element IS1 protein InsB